ncbi:MAG: lysylphosphatidylglycerol synthase transmembrane domain-containing protein [Candidatus Saccharimonadales bacterium]
MKKRFGLVSTVFFIAIFFYYFINNREVFYELASVSALALVLISLLKVGKILNSSLYNIATVGAYGKKLPFWDSFYMSLLTTIGNYFGPLLGGAGIRAMYLKKKYKFAYTDFIATLSGFYIISFSVASLIGLLSLWHIQTQTGEYMPILYLLFGSLLTFTVFLALAPNKKFLKLIPQNVKPLAGLTTTLDRVLDGWDLIRHNAKLFIRLSWLTLGGIMLAFFTSLVEFWALGIDLSIAPLFLYSTLSTVTLLVSITPGSIGIKEGIYIFTSDLLGITNAQVLQLAVIDRGVNYVVLFVLYLILRAPKLKQKIREGHIA